MSILDYSRDQVQKLVDSGMLRKESLRHWEICKAIADGKKQNAVAEAFDVSDVRHVRWIKNKKCPGCK